MHYSHVYRGHFNVRNGGSITNLPDDCIIEAPGFVDTFGINMDSNIILPEACAMTCRHSVDVQRLGKDAAIHGDVTMLKQVMLHDPLVGAICTLDEIWQMTDELLVAQSKWLPNFAKSDIDAVRCRMRKPTVMTKAWAGRYRGSRKCGSTPIRKRSQACPNFRPLASGGGKG